MDKNTLIYFLKWLRQSLYFSALLYFPVYLAGIGKSGIEIGFLFALSSITALVLIFPMGIMNDKILSKKLFIASFIIIGMSYLLASLSELSIVLIFAFILFGLGSNLSTASLDSLYYKCVRKNMERSAGIYNFSSALGSASGIVLTGFLLVRYDFRFFLIVAGGVFLLSSILGLRLPRTETKIVSLPEYWKNFKSEEVIIFAGIMFLYAMHFGAENTSYTLFLKNNLGLGFAGMGIYMAIPILILSVLSLKIGRMLEKINMKNLLSFGIVLSGIGHILMTIQNVPVSFFFRIIHEIGDATVLVILVFGISKLFKRSHVGGLNGLFTLVITIAVVLGSLIFGPIGETFGYHIPLIVSGIIMLTALPLVVIQKFKKISNS